MRSLTNRVCNSSKSSQGLSILLALLVVLSALASRPGQARIEKYDSIKNEQPSLSSLLNPDGTLNTSSGFNGSRDARGWKMKLGAKGEPHFAPAAAACAPGDQYWDTQFKLAGVDGFVNAIAVMGDDVYVGGRFNSAGNIRAANIAKWNRLNNTWSTIGNGVNGTVFVITVSENDVSGTDVIYVGGAFTTAFSSNGNSVSVNNVARLDGESWSALGSGSGATGNGVDREVHAIAVDGNDVYVGGAFTTAYNSGGISANRIAKWDGLLGTWLALGNDSGPSGNGVDGPVYAIALRPVSESENFVYVGGDFRTVYLSAISSLPVGYVAKWTGSHWEGLGQNYSTAFPGNGVNSVVNDIVVRFGEIYVGGCFTAAYNNIGDVVFASFIASWDGSKWNKLSIDQALNLNGLSGGCVFDMELSASGIYVSGAFTTAFNGGTGISTNQVAKWDPVNARWSALGASSGSTGNGLGDWGFAIAVNGSDVYVGGRFNEAYNSQGSNVRAIRIARWDGGSWSAMAASGNGADIAVDTIAVSGGNVYVGGWFTAIGNISANRIAKWNGTTWSALGSGSGPTGNGLNSVVKFLTVNGNDVYVGGLFTTAYNSNGSSVSANHVAKWNGSSWSSLGNGSGPTGNGVNGDVFAIAVKGSDVYVGGPFTTAHNSSGNSVSANNIAKWNGVSWSALGSGSGLTGNGVNGTVVDIEVSESGVVYVGGQFTTAYNAGLAPPNNIVSANRIAKWDGTFWSAIGSGSGPTGNGVNGNVSDIEMSGSDVYVGGSFATAYNSDNSSVSANNVAKWNGASWSALGSGAGPTGNGVNFYVNAIVVNRSDVYVGGGFTAAYNSSSSGVSARNVAKWNGSYWTNLGNGTPGDVVGLALKGDDLYVGGLFSMAGCNPSINLARYFLPATNTTVADANATFSTNNQTVSLNASINNSAGSVNEGLVTFKVKDGSTIIGSPVTGLVTSGNATASYTLPGSTATGAYTIEAFYSGSLFGSSLDTATLTVAPPTCTTTTITSHPSNQTVMTGTSVSFTVAASGTGLSYQWRKNGSPLSNGGKISGANAATLMINSVALIDAGTYDVVIFGGCIAVTSNPAVLTVTSGPSPILISEFRLAGPSGADDYFVELYNNTEAAISTGNLAIVLVRSDGAPIVFPLNAIPAVQIPARGYYLFAGKDYSLNLSDVNLQNTNPLPAGAPLAAVGVHNSATPSAANRLDSAADTSLIGSLFYREGTALLSLGTGPFAAQHSWMRKLATGKPADTNDNRADFSLVSPAGGTINGVTAALGAVSPQGMTSPVQHNDTMPSGFMDPNVSGASPPNRVRNTTPVPNGVLGTLVLRRKFTNSTGAPVTRMRFRVVDITNSPTGTLADLRVLSSVDAVINGQQVRGLTLEQPPAQPSGGGLNSTLAVGVITLANPLPAGQSVNVEFLLGVMRAGGFRFFVNIESLP